MSGKIYLAIPAIMTKVGHVGKTRTNQQQHYDFRGIDDVMAALQQVMAAEGVCVVPFCDEIHNDTFTTAKGTPMFRVTGRFRFRFYADDGSFIEACTIGEAMDSGDKASNKAMSVALKYALTQTFMIPTTEPKDPENDSPAVVATGPDPIWPAVKDKFLAFLKSKGLTLEEVNEGRATAGLVPIEQAGEPERMRVAREIAANTQGAKP